MKLVIYKCSLTEDQIFISYWLFQITNWKYKNKTFLFGWSKWIVVLLNCYVKWSEVAQLCRTLPNPMDFSLQGSSVHGIFQARVLEWVAISFSKGSSWLRDWTWVSHIAGRSFTIWATKEAQPVILVRIKTLNGSILKYVLWES